MAKNILIILTLLFFVSCSRSNTASNEVDVDNIELSEAEEFDDVMLDSSEGDRRIALNSENEGGLVIEGQDFSQEAPIKEVSEQDPALAGLDRLVEEKRNASYQTYKVKKNETLMLISYKLYGDYSRWRELQQLNADQIGSSGRLSQGMKIQYSSLGAGFNGNKSGSPYLIKRNDTLSKISTKVYGKSTHWRPIWKNNRRMIPNPNRIFAGFTLYYPDL